MRKERKSKDLLLDAILLRALEEENKELEREIRAANEALTKEEDERLKALLKATWKKEQARQRRNRYLLRTAACFAVMLVVSFSVVMNVQAWRNDVVNYVLTFFEDHGTLSTPKISSENTLVRYIPTYIPERYFNDEIVLENERTLLLNYYGDDYSVSMAYQLFYKESELFFDSENATVEVLDQNGEEIIILSKNNERQLIGTIPGTGYKYTITGQLTEEEILNISKSISLQTEE